jgi:hypothetical protein
MKLIHILISLLFFSFSFSAYAGKVMKVKGEKVYIVFDQEDPFTEGDYFILNNAEGKKLGLVQIKKIKGLKAIGVLKKGKASKGFTTTFKSASKKAKKESVAVAEDSGSEMENDGDTKSTSRMGVLVGYGMASQDVDQGGQGISAQSGSSIAVRGLYDYPLFSSVYVRGMAGTEFLSVTGDGAPLAAPSTRTTIGTDITYLALDALFHWSVMKGSSSTIYLIGGMGILYPMAKTSDAILEDSIDSLAIGEFGAGFEFNLNGYSLPFEVTYYYFPSGEDVETNVISLKLGLLF